jgi:hypothetical protein
MRFSLHFGSHSRDLRFSAKFAARRRDAMLAGAPMSRPQRRVDAFAQRSIPAGG